MATTQPKERFSLKDHLFNRAKVTYLADLFAANDAAFDRDGFVRSVMKTLPTLELKARIGLIADVLAEQLDSDFAVAAQQILRALPAPLDPTKSDDDFGDFIFAPLGEYVVRHGMDTQHVHTSLSLLAEITQRFSMEDAIRFFINAHETRTMAELVRWATHPNYHVRRLASEGTRHLLPWSGRIHIPVTAPLPILDLLHADATRYVTRSVANHLNDIAKVEPELVIKTLTAWRAAGKQQSKELDWITSHALRTLVKDGNQAALALLGYRSNPVVTVTDFVVAPTATQITKDGTLLFSFTITAEADERLMIDYVIDFVKATGKTAPKVFKLKKTQLTTGETIMVEKKHRFMSTATTYTLYPGKHTLTLQINGKQYGSVTFTIT